MADMGVSPMPPALARVVVASSKPGLHELQSPSVDRRPLDEVLDTMRPPTSASNSQQHDVLQPSSSSNTTNVARIASGVLPPPPAMTATSPSPIRTFHTPTSSNAVTIISSTIDSSDRASITPSVGPPDYRSMVSGILPGFGTVERQEYAEKLRLLEVVMLNYSDAPAYFNILRPEKLETRISNVTYSTRIASLNAQLSSKTDFKAFRRPLFVVTALLMIYFFVAAAIAYLVPDLKIAMDVSAALALALFLILRLGALSYKPKYLTQCTEAVKAWTLEDAALGVNLVYKFTHLMPTDFDTLRYCAIEVYEKVLYNHSDGIVEFTEHLPAYVA
ncbi:hypothetical protein BC830DRAFT_1118467 [Chytriomyces sp. MP71]|nr:hypothetical protein BC830DRAFT_1118467 [Chytriomyces sp. MP71]